MGHRGEGVLFFILLIGKPEVPFPAFMGERKKEFQNGEIMKRSRKVGERGKTLISKFAEGL